MDSLHGTEWDVVIAGTGLQESLLVLALSRSNKKVLHVDKNDYYGGAAAALNLQDAEVWVKGVNSEPENGKLFSSASIVKPESASRSDAQTHAERSPSLGPPRRYSLSLSPTIIYARSALLSSLVSARVDQQIDFVASGNTWLLQPLSSASQPTLTKVPGSREDIVSDKSVDARAKRSIIKFLRFVGDLDAQRETWESEVDSPFSDFLREKFGLSEQVEKPIHALTMSSKSVMNTKTEWALRRIEGHLKSMNVLGPGFGSVVPKWGGLGEVVQVACRAQAVGGGTYVLGQGVTNVQDSTGSEGRSLMVELTSGEKVSCNWVVSGYNNIPTAKQNDIQFETLSTHSISIISRPLSALFAHPSEDSPEPASAIVNVSEDGGTPIHIVAHSSASGECPDGQCILYASIAQPSAFPVLEHAITSLISALDASATVLWRLQYQRHQASSTALSRPGDNVLVFPPLSTDVVFNDDVLEPVREAWQVVLDSEDSEAEFLRFAPREGEEVASGDVE